MRDPVTPCRRKFTSVPVWSDQGCFRGSLSSPTSLSDSHGILEHWQRWSLWSGLVSLLICSGICLFFKASLATLKRTTICSTTAVISQTSEVNSSRFFGGHYFNFPGDLRSSRRFSTPSLPFSMSHRQNPVNPDGAVARLKSLYASEIWKREENKHTRECCFKFLCDSMTYVWPRKCTRYNEVQENNRIIVLLSRSFAVFHKLLYLISVFLYSLKLCQRFRAVKTDLISLFMSNYLFTPRALE